jgi:hypothetical protein
MRKQIIEQYAQIKELPKANLEDLVNKTNKDLATEDALNLISKLL